MRDRGFHCKFPGCSRIYASKYNVRRHMTYTHPEYHQFECLVCQKVLSSRQNYRQHQYIHTGARPFICDICGEGYRQGSQLTIHRRGHMAEARSLPICKVRSIQLTDMLRLHDLENPLHEPGVRMACPVILPALVYSEKQRDEMMVRLPMQVSQT